MRETFKLDCNAQPRLERIWILTRLYPVPVPLTSEEDRERFCHEDLIRLTAAELGVERSRVVWRLTFDDEPDAWLLARLDAIDLRLSHVA